MRTSLLVNVNHRGSPAITDRVFTSLKQFGRVHIVQPTAFLVHTRTSPEKIKTQVRQLLDTEHDSVHVATVVAMI